MPVTITVYYARDLKRGDPANAATFRQWIEQEKHAPGFPGARQLVPLSIINQVGNRYVVDPITAPLHPAPVSINVTAPDLPPISGGSTDVAMNVGESIEVRVGYQR